MPYATRMILIVMLMLPILGELSAQETTSRTETTTTATATAATDSAARPADDAGRSSEEIRNLFSALLRQRPPELGTIFALDPTLLSDEAFLARYPDVARFVAEHPEVRHNPRFYLAEFPVGRRQNAFEELLEPLSVIFVFVLIAFAVAWLVRTMIEQKRWNKLSRTQSEVHTKILDRFSTSTELLEYIRTPAGTKFLESAPIPLHTQQGASNPPVPRVLWSIQVGVVVAATALGLLLVSARFEGEASQGFFAMGVIAFSVGVGFIGSAVVSIVLSRRLGGAQPADDPGLVQ